MHQQMDSTPEGLRDKVDCLLNPEQSMQSLNFAVSR